MAIPSKRLVGKNMSYSKGAYSDDYLKALNKFAPVKDVFGNQRESIAEGKPVVAKLVMGTLGKCEYENHLVSVVMGAAKAGRWAAVERNQDQMMGLDVVIEKDFGYSVNHKGKTFLLPSPLYAAYCKAQLEK